MTTVKTLDTVDKTREGRKGMNPKYLRENSPGVENSSMQKLQLGGSKLVC